MNEKYLEEVKIYTLEKFKAIDAKIVVFGSVARGDSHRGSDVDIGFIPSKGIESEFLSKFKEGLENLNVPCKIDIVNLAETSDEFRNNALKGAITWRD